MRRRPSASRWRWKRPWSPRRSRSGCSIVDRAVSRFSPITRSRRPREALLRLIAQSAGDSELGTLRIEVMPEADWVTLSQGKRGPVAAGRFLVHGSHDRGRLPPRLLAIEIDAGQAFGTAHHASTRGCLLALDDILKRRRPRIVVDIGTGTGILAIAAAKALRQRVIASDNDPLAVRIAAENARMNGVGSLVSAFKARGFDHPRLRRRKADLVLANLLESGAVRPRPGHRQICCAGRQGDPFGPHRSPGASHRGALPEALASPWKSDSFSMDGRPW